MSLVLIIIGCYLCFVVVVLAFALAFGKAASTADDQMDRAAETEGLARAAGARLPGSRARTTSDQRQAVCATEAPLTRGAATSTPAPRPSPPSVPAVPVTQSLRTTRLSATEPSR
jgi:hypothetical protein